MSISNYMIDEIAIGAYTGDDNLDGVPQFTAQAIVKARIEESNQTVRKADGTDINITTSVSTMATIDVRDRIWIAPFQGNNLPRTFPVGFVFLDADAFSPVMVKNARKMRALDGHFEFYL